jgi:transposase
VPTISRACRCNAAKRPDRQKSPRRMAANFAKIRICSPRQLLRERRPPTAAISPAPCRHNPRECRQFAHSRKSNRRERTGSLGREDSNSQMSPPKLAFEVWPEFPFIFERLAIRDFSRLSCQRVTCAPVQSAMEYGAPIAPPSRSSHAREAASLDPRVRIHFRVWENRPHSWKLRSQLSLNTRFNSGTHRRLSALARPARPLPRYLPPYRPDLNPIERAFAKLKALLRKPAARTVESLWHALADLLDRFTPQECANYLANAEYAPLNRSRL